MKTTILILSILLTAFSFSQTFEGKLVDDKNKPLAGVSVQHIFSSEKIKSNKEGLFYFDLKRDLILEIYGDKYASKIVKVASIFTEDTIRKTYKLESVQMLESVEISSGRVKSAIRKKDVHVLDYIPYSTYMISLTLSRGERFISINNLTNDVVLERKLDFTAQNLAVDCLDNLHILSNDSSYQMVLDTLFKIAFVEPIGVFYNNIEPCLADFGTMQYASFWRDHNKTYELKQYNKATKEFEGVITVIDRPAGRSAQEYYDSLVRQYRKLNQEFNEPRFRLIEERRATNELPENAVLNRELFQMMNWYQTVVARPLDVTTIRVGNNLKVLDFENHTSYTLNRFGEILDTTELRNIPEKKVQLIRDEVTEEVFLSVPESYYFNIYKLDLETGNATKVLKLDDYNFVESIKINNGWIYFLEAENQFFKVFKVDMKANRLTEVE